MNESIDRAELLELLPRLKRFCLTLARSDADADDLLQATVERLLSKGAPKKADLRKWSFRVCRNIWIDEIRSRTVRDATPIDDAPDANPVDGERIALSTISFKRVQSAINELPEEQRATLTLVALEGCSYKEAAEVLDTPIGTVMSRVARARAALASTFAEELT